MKTRCLSGGVIINRIFSHLRFRTSFALVILLTSLCPDRPAMADSQLDRTYALESVGYLKAWDNVDGIFSQYVSEAIQEYFSGQSRFVLQDVSRANEVLERSKLDYKKIIEDNEVLAQMARSTKSQTLLRTKIVKEGPSYKFHMEWLHTPRMDTLAEEKFTLENVGDVKQLVRAALVRLIEKIPFKATLTGRDHENVTINIGENENVSPGDEMVVATLEEVKRHPLLHTIVDWRLGETGRVRIESVEHGIAFGKVISETPGREIARYQKVTKIFSSPRKQAADPVEKMTDEAERHAKYLVPPRLGWVSGGAWAGTFGREATTSAGAGRDGGGIFIGGKADGQLWLTREVFAEAGLGYGFSAYSQKDSVTGAESTINGSLSLFSLRTAIGYTYFTTPDFFGPKGWAKLGFRSTSYSMTANAADFVGPSSFKGLYLGIGGELPVRERFGALMNLDFGVLTSASASTLSALGNIAGATDVNFQLGGYYRHTPRMTFRVVVDVTSSGADFSDGNMNQRIISVVPSVLMYF